MPVQEEKTYDLPCYVCSEVFVCSRWGVTTVIDPPQPICKKCLAKFKPCSKAQAALTKYYGNGAEIPGWNKELRAFIHAVEDCKVRPRYLGWFHDKFRAWIHYAPALKDAHPKRCLCGQCEHDKQQLAKAPSKDLVELVLRVDAAVLHTFVGD